MAFNVQDKGYFRQYFYKDFSLVTAWGGAFPLERVPTIASLMPNRCLVGSLQNPKKGFCVLEVFSGEPPGLFRFQSGIGVGAHITRISMTKEGELDALEKLCAEVSFVSTPSPQEITEGDLETLFYYGDTVGPLCRDIAAERSSTTKKAFGALLYGLFLQDHEGYSFELSRRAALEAYLVEQDIPI